MSVRAEVSKQCGKLDVRRRPSIAEAERAVRARQLVTLVSGFVGGVSVLISGRTLVR